MTAVVDDGLVLAEVEAGPDRDAVGGASAGEDVVEGMVVDDVELGAKTEVLVDGEVSAASDPVEAGPIGLRAAGDELGDDGALEGIGGGSRSGVLMQSTQ